MQAYFENKIDNVTSVDELSLVIKIEIGTQIRSCKMSAVFVPRVGLFYLLQGQLLDRQAHSKVVPVKKNETIVHIIED